MNAFVRTKIVCTIGPATESIETLKALIGAGMDIARINCSHGDRQQHAQLIANIRAASAQAGEPVAILMDLSGPKIRTGTVENGAVELKKGEKLTLTIDQVPGTAQTVSVNYAELPREISPGDPILLDDGKMVLTTVSKTDRSVTAIVAGAEDCRNAGDAAHRSAIWPTAATATGGRNARYWTIWRVERQRYFASR